MRLALALILAATAAPLVAAANPVTMPTKQTLLDRPGPAIFSNR